MLRCWPCPVDDVAAHHAWIADINETQETTLTYPILADVDRKVALLYGMIHPEADSTLTVRSVFVIGPQKKGATNTDLSCFYRA